VCCDVVALDSVLRVHVLSRCVNRVVWVVVFVYDARCICCVNGNYTTMKVHLMYAFALPLGVDSEGNRRRRLEPGSSIYF
jgi:hypothetical protein